jgi:hypothetical protein
MAGAVVSGALAVLPVPAGAELPADVSGLLDAFGGPAAFRVPGRDRRRTRAVVTLLHGDEPSGVRALHAWLRGGRTPAVDVLCLLGAVAAARHPPGFAYRALPGTRDLNRCFRAPFDGPEGAIAHAMLTALEQADCEALVDLHNNSGHNPVYGVGSRLDAACLELVGFFASRFVHSTIRLGTLVEAVVAGRAADPRADRAALDGLERFVGAERLVQKPPPIEILRNPVRVRVREAVSLSFGNGPRDGAGLTLTCDLDRHNFELVSAGTTLGWVPEAGTWPIEAHGADERDVSAELFECRGGRLLTRVPILPMMMTLDAAAARADCLFYAVPVSSSPRWTP